MGKPDTAGVVARPPLIYLAAVVVGFVLRALAPTPFFPRALGYQLGAILILIAVALLLWGVREMRRAGTSESTAVPTSALVTTGPFRLSRNPLYVSLTLCYLGTMIAAQALWGLALAVVVLAVMRRGVIDREERYMERRFGAEYLRYKERVRRWM
ncbi:MAG TPA: isoprenylcysteine carboxylmethyltransferase family protein [bacterium]|nr:isoprenylcysteine carboxylmethyltransferase family protein [bacterium]